MRLANYIEHWFPRGENWGIYNCRTVSGSSSYSLHAAAGPTTTILGPQRRRQGRKDALVAAFLRADTKGNKYALAKRFGVQGDHLELQDLTAARAGEGLRPYGACPTSNDTIAHRDHVHIGQNLRGAERRTTAYTAGACASPATACAADRRGPSGRPLDGARAGPDRAARAAEPRRGAPGGDGRTWQGGCAAWGDHAAYPACRQLIGARPSSLSTARPGRSTTSRDRASTAAASGRARQRTPKMRVVAPQVTVSVLAPVANPPEPLPAYT